MLRRRSIIGGVALALVCVCAVAAQQASGDRVAGQVVSAVDGHPLPHATVTLRNSKSGKLVGSVSADDDGHYSFETVAAGKYSLSGITHGYFSAAYDNHEGFSTAIVTGAGLSTDTLTLRLTPLASIGGRIVDEAGDPVENAMVQVYREDPNQGGQIRVYRGTSTQSGGTFEISRLLPGKYYLSASGAPWYAVHAQGENGNNFQYRTSVSPAVDVAYPLTFYPHALNSDEATPVELHGGEQLTLDMELAAQPAMTLSVRMQPGQRPGSSPQPQLVQSVFGVDEPVMVRQVSYGEGAQLFQGLPPGQYKLRQMTPNGMGTGGSSVDLTTGSVSMDSLPVPDLATLSVAVHMANGEPLPAQTQILLQTDQPGTMLPGVNVSDKGTFTFAGVAPGTYRFVMDASNRQLNPMRLVVDGHEVAAKTLRVAGAGAMKAELTVAAEMVEVEGFAVRDGKAAAGSMILLVPAGGDTDTQLFRRDQSDLDGSFVLHAVVPGNYILVAIDDGWKLRWNDPAALTGYLLHGLPVVVKANGKATFHIADKVSTQPRQ